MSYQASSKNYCWRHCVTTWVKNHHLRLRLGFVVARHPKQTLTRQLSWASSPWLGLDGPLRCTLSDRDWEHTLSWYMRLAQTVSQERSVLGRGSNFRRSVPCLFYCVSSCQEHFAVSFEADDVDPGLDGSATRTSLDHARFKPTVTTSEIPAGRGSFIPVHAQN